MKINLLLATIIVVLLFSLLTKAQGGPCNDCLSFESPKIYLEKSESQILSIQAKLFEFKVNGQKSWNSRFFIYSYDKNFNYFQLKDNNDKPYLLSPNAVILTADKIIISNNLIYYHALRERIINGERKGFIGFTPIVKDGKVFDEKNSEVTGILGESLTVDYSLEEFKKLINVNNIKIEIGRKTYNLKKEQVDKITKVAKEISSNNL